jgi:hypothetical protein
MPLSVCHLGRSKRRLSTSLMMTGRSSSSRQVANVCLVSPRSVAVSDVMFSPCMQLNEKEFREVIGILKEAGDDGEE